MWYFCQQKNALIKGNWNDEFFRKVLALPPGGLAQFQPPELVFSWIWKGGGVKGLEFAAFSLEGAFGAEMMESEEVALGSVWSHSSWVSGGAGGNVFWTSPMTEVAQKIISKIKQTSINFFRGIMISIPFSLTILL